MVLLHFYGIAATVALLASALSAFPFNRQSPGIPILSSQAISKPWDVGKEFWTGSWVTWVAAIFLTLVNEVTGQII